MKLFFHEVWSSYTVFGPGKPFQPGLIFAIKHNLRLIRLASGKRYSLLSLFSSDKEKSLVTMTYFYCVGTWQAFLA